MRRYILGVSGLCFIVFSLLFTSWKKSSSLEEKTINANITPLRKAYLNYAEHIYDSAHLKEAGLTFAVFEKALTGFYNLKKSGRISKSPLLTIADFDQSSSKKRLYIINLAEESMVLNTWVAHGQKSGDDQAVTFSNQNDSFTSSIGFYVTGEEYQGAHGRSLKLDGMDPGFNDNARMRSIVIHGAPYVSEGTIAALGRLGRSQGCPAVAPEFCNEVINTLGSGSVLFINKSEVDYHSPYLNENNAAVFAQVPVSLNSDLAIVHQD